MLLMRVGVIDVGANTLRLLVAGLDGAGGVSSLHTTRVELGLGAHIEQTGTIPAAKIALAAEAAREEAAVARRFGCEVVELVVTSPGRQAANAEELIDALSHVSGVRVRVLTAEEEATHAYEGAIAVASDLPETVAVVDVGGGSTQVVVGSRDRGPAWLRSLDIGSLRLTRRAFHDDPPTNDDLERARAIVDPLFAELAPPLPQAAFATGGSARAVRKLVGPTLGPMELQAALKIASERSSRRLVKSFDVSPRRAQTVVAGVILLASAQRLLGVPLTVARGGLREGIAARLLTDAAAAA
jgi:exopolyphosphatase/guanosine-5'-triphosphate,3'-diphosphate pyrophosphatase